MKVYSCFPGGLSKALTMSYDDGKYPDRRLVEIFNKYGIKATFNLNYGQMGAEPRMSVEEIGDLYKGHEIATHSFTHPTIAREPMAEAAREILKDREGLEEMTGEIIRGHAYPNGSYSGEIKALFKSLGIAYARTTKATETYELPADPMEWNPTCHHNDPRLFEHADFIVDFPKKQYLKLLYVWGHSYEFDNDDNWDRIEKFCEKVSGKSDIWYATNIEIIDYMERAKRLRFDAACTRVFNPSSESVWLQVDTDKYIEAMPGETTHLLDAVKR